MNFGDLSRPERLRRLMAVWVAPVVLFAVNAAIAAKLFRLEYSANFGSNEGQFIALTRGVARYLGDLSWWPEWSCGLPFVNTYLPLVHTSAGVWSRLSGVSAALAYHQTAAMFFCIAPVFVYWMARRMTGKAVTSFLAALLFTAFSPCALLPAFRVDLGSLWNLRRLQILAFYGEGAHTAAIAFLPLALLFLFLVAERATWKRSLFAGVFLGLTVLSNAFGAVILACGAAALLATAPARRFWRVAAAFVIVAALAYCWISPALPPSVVAAIRANSPTVDGDYRFNTLSAVGAALLAAGFALAWLVSRAWRAHLRFFLLFAWLMSGIVILGVMAHIYVVPQPHRYQIAMDLSLCLLAVFGAAELIERFAPRAAVCVAIAATIFLGVQARHCVRYGRGLIQSADPTKTAMYRATRWLEDHKPGQRSMVSGSYSFYTNDFSDVPQMHGGQDPMLPGFMIRVAVFTLYSGMNTGARDAEISTTWLKALGARSVVVPGPHSEETYKPFANPRKFDGVLPVLYREGDDTIYEVPARSASLAHVMEPGDIVRHEPVNGLDTPELERYVAAMDSPRYPEAQFRWTSRHSAVIDARIAPGQMVSVQETFHPGWRATVDGRAQEVAPDGLGFLTVKPACQGPCRIALTFDGGPERGLTTALSLLAVFAVAISGVASGRRRKRGDVERKPGELRS